MSGRRQAAALAALLLAGAAMAGPLEVRSSGGEPGRMRRYLAPRDSAEAVILLRFSGGYADEQVGSGIPLLAQHALLTAHRKVKLPAAVDAYHGGTAELTMSLGPHESAFLLRAHRREILDAAETLCAQVFSPALDGGAFPAAVERSTVNAGHRFPVHDLLARLSMYTFISDARYRPEVEPDRVETLTLATVKKHVDGVYTPGNATVIATGGFPAGGLDSLLDRFSGSDRTPVIRTPKLVLPINHRFKARQERHQFFFPMELGSRKAVAAGRVAAALFEDRLEQRIRRMGHALAPEVRLIAMTPFQGLAVGVPDHPPANADLGALVRQEATVLREGRSAPEDLKAAKAAAARRLLEVDRRPARLAEELLAGAQAQGAGEWLGPDSVKDIEALTPQELVELVGPSLAPERSVFLFFSPEVTPMDATTVPEGDLR